MRFQRESSPPPWLNRKDQYRMLGMLSLLLLVALCIDAARRPENWNWFVLLTPNQEQQETGLEDIDFRVKTQSRLTQPESFLAVAEPHPPGSAEVPAHIQQIPPDELQGIEDQRLGRLRSEDAPFARVLQQLEQFNSAQLLAAARTDVTYRVVNVEPDEFRGELLKIEGLLWRLERWKYGDPEDEHDDLYQAWIMTDDSGNNPWTVVFTEKPEGVALGNAIDRRVSVAGYFFKRYAYPTETGLHVAPMLIARNLQLAPLAPAGQEETAELTKYVIGLLVVIAVAFAFLGGWFVISDRRYRRSRTAKIAERRLDAAPEVVAHLNELPTHDPADTFRRLNESHAGNSGTAGADPSGTGTVDPYNKS